MQCDVLIRGGTIIDPSQGMNVPGDVAVTGDRITALAGELPDFQADHVIDADGRMVALIGNGPRRKANADMILTALLSADRGGDVKTTHSVEVEVEVPDPHPGGER